MYDHDSWDEGSGLMLEMVTRVARALASSSHCLDKRSYERGSRSKWRSGQVDIMV